MKSWDCHQLGQPGDSQQRTLEVGHVPVDACRDCLADRPEPGRHKEADSQTNPDSHGKECENRAVKWRSTGGSQVRVKPSERQRPQSQANAEGVDLA